MSEIDFTTYDDEALEVLRVAVIVESERRQRQAQVPAQVADLARRYTEEGGDPAVLTAAVEAAMTSAPEPEQIEEPAPEPDPEPVVEPAPDSEPQA